MNRRELARLITRVENGDPGAQAVLSGLYPHTGRARIVGVTGAPGSGKSTLVAELVRELRGAAGAPPVAAPQVAVIAVDPSSPFSGGAILGDRIRMRDLFTDPGVFIRSMASRGALGGIASATADVAGLLDAYGFDFILIETVGAGQLEVDVARVAQSVIVVEAPGAGDEIQAVKAGILEIADIVVVNKADREGVAQTISALQAALDLAPNPAPHAALSGPADHTGRHDAAAQNTQALNEEEGLREGWRTPIVKASALNHEGIADVLAALARHTEYLRISGEGERRNARRAESDILARLRELLLRRALQRLPAGQYRALVAESVQHRLHPAEAAEQLARLLSENP
jgi:LAO/AO transport system kinase